MGSFTESVVEDAALDWFAELGERCDRGALVAQNEDEPRLY